MADTITLGRLLDTLNGIHGALNGTGIDPESLPVWFIDEKMMPLAIGDVEIHHAHETDVVTVLLVEGSDG